MDYKLLIVDDEYIERNALRFIIGNSCSSIGSMEEAANGKDAINKAVSFKPDIILMDIKMPGINGIEASKAIKEFLPQCRIVFLTAFDYFDYAQEALKIGVEDFIIKPATNEQVIEIVNKTAASLKNEKASLTRQIELEKKLGQVTQFLENEFVSSILNGDMDERQILEYFTVMNIESSKGFAAVVNINFKKSFVPIDSQFQKDMIKKRCMEKLKEAFSKFGYLCLVAHTGSMIQLLILCRNTASEELGQPDAFNLLSDIHKAVSETINVGIIIGIGSCCTTPGEFYISFLQARAACKSIGHTSNIICFSELKQKSFDKYPNELESRLLDKILTLDHMEALLILDDLIGWMVENLVSLEAMRWKAFEVLIILFRTCSREFRIADRDIKTCFGELQSITTVSELKSYLNHEIKSITNEISSLKVDRSGSLVDKVCEFIKQNYNSELSLDEAAGMVGLSNFYFSKLFKHHKNMNFIDYITEVRIKRAKELLKDPEINIKEIGNLIGYSDPNYFARVFKRIEGISPTEYRSKKMLS